MEFDDDGDRLSSKYKILNVNRNELIQVGELKVEISYYKKE